MSQIGPAPLGGDVDRGPEALVICWVMTAMGILVVLMRFVGRRMMRSTGPDDWMMLLTLILFIFFVAILTKDISIGGMRHLYYLTPEERTEAAKWSWISQPFHIMGFATGKISVGILILRVTGSTTFWRRRILWFAIITALLISAVNIILTFTQCSPVEALWNTQLVVEGKAKCWRSSIQTDFAIFLSGYNILVDLFLAFLPASFFYNLNLTWKKKVELCILLGLGVIAAIFAAVKTTYLVALNERSDITWETYNLYMWSGAELFVIILCGSVPPIKPVYDYLLGKPKNRSANNPGYGGFTSNTSYIRSSSRTSPGDPFKGREVEELELYSPSIRLDTNNARSDSSSLP
ncbi:uncharacterized protein G6M90_00g093400 [Metarhizium brunneum]|uniref:Rhodopsin domain-containing protein n=1 Tax=Metarhizium brunneum TaxID=500148 RepID=A0A7D5Z511_9HYPO